MTKNEALYKVKGYLTDIIPEENYLEVEEIIKALEQETCEDCISRQGAIDAINKDIMGGLNYKSILERLPSADRPQGEWVVKDGVFYCSCCDNDSAGLSEDDVYVYGIPLPNYCSHCGARMERL